MRLIFQKKILFVILFWFLIFDLKAESFFVKSDSLPTYSVYVFLSETCPMSQSYVSVLNKIQETYKNKSIEVIGIFPNFFTTDSSVAVFRKEFGTEFKLRRDIGFVFTNLLNAHITPEVFLMDKNKKVLYSGSIDNAYFRAGKRRGKTSADYLIDAIENMLTDKKIEVQRVEPFGCLIVKD